MNKLMKYGMIGAMVLGAQSMVFASGIGNLKSDVTPTKGAEAQIVKFIDMNKEVLKDGDAIEHMAVAMSVETTPLTESEKAELVRAEKEQIKKICEALNMTYKEEMTLAGIYENLTQDQFNILVEKKVIQVVGAVMTTEAMAAEQK